jgi:DNA-binding MarR family transcriptional regulator
MKQQHTPATTSTTALIEEALDTQQRAIKYLQIFQEPQWLLLNLSMIQFKALMLLDSGVRLTIGQLAHKLGMTKPAASILVEKLVQTGLVERTEDATDRRRTFIQLTALGADRVTCLLHVRREQMRVLLQRMSPADVLALNQGTLALARAVKETLAEQPDVACPPEAQES